MLRFLMVLFIGFAILGCKANATYKIKINKQQTVPLAQPSPWVPSPDDKDWKDK